MKKSGNKQIETQKKRLTKEELIDKMYFYLDCQTKIAEHKRIQYEKYENDPACDKDGKPLKNPYLLEFNNEVDAISRTSAAIIRIDGSELEDDEDNEEEKHKKRKELVD